MNDLQFRCIRCKEIKTNPDDRNGTPKYFESLEEYRGLCLECGEKEPKVETHVAQAAMDELAHYTEVMEFLDHLSESKYTPIDFSKTKEKNLTIDKTKS